MNPETTPQKDGLHCVYDRCQGPPNGPMPMCSPGCSFTMRTIPPSLGYVPDGKSRTAQRWGWNGDMCAVWSEAIIIGETRDEKEKRARLFSAAPSILDAMKGLIDFIEIDNLPMNRDALQIARAAIAQVEPTTPDSLDAR